MEKFSASAWRALGDEVKRSREAMPAYREMREWAAEVGRSTRILQGLERGEQTGEATLHRIERLLGWPYGQAIQLLRQAEGGKIVGPRPQTADSDDDLRFRKPEGWTDERWARRKQRLREFDEMLDEAAEER